MIFIRSQIFTIGLFFSFLLISSCGGGSSSENTSISSPLTLKGVFIDGAVDGLAYRTPTKSGYTDESGFFEYIDGEDVSFSIADIQLGTAKAQPNMTPLELLLDGEDESSPRFINIIRLLQTLDFDNELSNGIKIPDVAHSISSEITFPLDVSVTDFESNQRILDFIKNVTGKDSLISEADALDHWKNSSESNLYFHFKTSDPKLPIIFGAYDGSKVMPTYDEQGTLTGGIFEDINGEKVILELSPDGTPKYLIVDNTHIVFSSFTQDTFDLGIIYEDGLIETVVGLQNNFALPNPVGNRLAYNGQLPPSQNFDLRKIDSALVAYVNKIAAEQIASLTVNKVLLNGKDLSKIVLSARNEATIALWKQAVIQEVSEKFNVDINILNSASTIFDIVQNSVECTAGSVSSCWSSILTSAQTTKEAVEILIETNQDIGRINELANLLNEQQNGKLSPIIVAEPTVIGLVEEGNNFYFQIFIETNKSKSNVDSSPVTNFSMLIDDKPAGAFNTNIKLITGSYKFTITGTDQFGLSTTVDINLTIPERPQINAESISIGPDNYTHNGTISVNPTGTYEYVVTDEPQRGAVSINNQTGAFEYTANDDAFNNDSFEVTANLALDNCKTSVTFDCRLSSLPGKIDVEILRPEQYINLSGQVLSVYDFEKVNVGESSSKTFTVENRGNTDLTISSIESSNGLYTITNIDNVIPPNGYGNFTITFTPVNGLIESSKITIKSNDQINSPFVIDVTGEGIVNPDITISVNGLIINTAEPVPVHDFGEIEVGSDSIPVSVVIGNIGTFELAVNQILNSDSRFQIPAIVTPLTIQPTLNEAFQVTFTPDNLSAFNTSLQIFSDDPDEPFYTFSMIGTGIDATNPVVEITSPIENEVINGTATFSANITDNHEIQDVVFYLNANVIGTANNPPYEIDFNSCDFPPGSNTFSVVATDISGNTAFQSTSFQVENLVNPIVFTSQAGFAASSNGLTTIDFESISPGTAVDQQYISSGIDFNALASSPNSDPVAELAGVHSGFNVPSASGANFMTVASGGVGYGGGGFEVEFSQGKSGFGMYVGGLHPASFQPSIVNLFDTSNTLLASFNLVDEIGSAPQDVLFFGVTGVCGLSKVQVEVGSNDFVYFDDVMFR